ncbi:CapA family protein [Peptoniphilus equinus]|uniref:CapA family protein n=1 Tax=Peptoniphilus equinus TaxID=3016343 RepID=A0ABY7QUJ5_9FIRM|nr:CapA family protein [Peptoniphilus equinus]WBW50111.1 CapA family protein [Peptoniphilus equinus]
MKTRSLYLTLLCILILTSCTGRVADAPSKGEPTLQKSTDAPTYHAKVWATGDIMYHEPTYRGGDFNQFEFVKEYIQGADLAIGNLETTINPHRSPAGHPLFNTPQEALEGLKDAGFDALSTSNNHCLDTGMEGVFTTQDAIKDYGLTYFGTKKPQEPPKILTVNGIAIGLMATTDLLNGLDGQLSPEERLLLTPSEHDVLIGEIQNLRSLGADVILAYTHGGIEYAEEPTPRQVAIESLLLDYGVDVVLGSHPHVLQRAHAVPGKTPRFAIYSMGNAVSNQRFEWLPHRGVESGVFVELNFEKKDQHTVLTSFILHPTFVDKKDGTTRVYLYSDIAEGGKYRDQIRDIKKADADYPWVVNRLETLNSWTPNGTL